MGKKVVKLGCLRGFFKNISRNMTDTEKMMMTNIIGNFVADNIVFDVSKSSESGDMAKKVVKITEKL